MSCFISRRQVAELLKSPTSAALLHRQRHEAFAARWTTPTQAMYVLSHFRPALILLFRQRRNMRAVMATRQAVLLSSIIMKICDNFRTSYAYQAMEPLPLRPWHAYTTA